jgi:hypothetical protein
MKKTIVTGFMMAATLASTSAMAEDLSPEQAWACRWSGGLTPPHIAEILDVEGRYLGPVAGFPDRLLVGYAMSEEAGAVVGYMPGAGGQLISYSLDVVGFEAPHWFEQPCRDISAAYVPRTEVVPITLTPCAFDPQTGECK